MTERQKKKRRRERRENDKEGGKEREQLGGVGMGVGEISLSPITLVEEEWR